MRQFRMFVSALCALSLLAGCGSPEPTDEQGSDQARINLFGEVRTTDGNTLPDNATVEIRLRRSDAEDLESGTAAITTISAASAPPYPFSLVYQPAELDPQARYVLDARAMTADGQLTHASRTPVPLPAPDDTVTVDLQISPVAPRAATSVPVVTAYRCDGIDIVVQTRDDDISLYGATEAPLHLRQVRAASGTRYEDEAGDQFWSHAREARLSVDGKTRECEEDPAGSRREAARLAGASVYAVGQEPGWFLTVVPDDRVTLVADYGSQVVILPPATTRSIDGGWLYTARTDAHDLRVVVRETPCMDTMSGARWPRTVSLTLDERAMEGCGARWETETRPAGRPG